MPAGFYTLSASSFPTPPLMIEGLAAYVLSCVWSRSCIRFSRYELKRLELALETREVLAEVSLFDQDPVP